MICHAVDHSANVAMVVLEGLGVALARAAVVDDDVAPAALGDGRTVNGAAYRGSEVFIAPAASKHARPDTLGLFWRLRFVIRFSDTAVVNDDVRLRLHWAQRDGRRCVFHRRRRGARRLHHRARCLRNGARSWNCWRSRWCFRFGFWRRCGGWRGIGDGGHLLAGF